jgi:hypothetical protein
MKQLMERLMIAGGSMSSFIPLESDNIAGVMSEGNNLYIKFAEEYMGYEWAVYYKAGMHREDIEKSPSPNRTFWDLIRGHSPGIPYHFRGDTKHKRTPGGRWDSVEGNDDNPGLPFLFDYVEAPSEADKKPEYSIEKENIPSGVRVHGYPWINQTFKSEEDIIKFWSSKSALIQKTIAEYHDVGMTLLVDKINRAMAREKW